MILHPKNWLLLFKQYFSNDKRYFYIEFIGKWEKPNDTSYKTGDAIVKDIDIKSESPDKTKIFFYFTEDSPRLDTNVNDSTPKELIITIRKSE